MIEEDPFGIQYAELLKKLFLFYEKYFTHDDVCKQVGKFHNEDVETFNILIQTMQNLSKNIPI